MDQVTVSRELLRQVLIALEGAQDNLREHGDNCFLHDEGQYNSCFCGRDSIDNHLQETVEALSALFDAPEAEPVLWMHQQGNHDELSERPLSDDEKARGWTEVPLFTASQSQPAPVQEQQPAPASKPVLLQCLGCERVGTQEQLSASTDCDCWLHAQPAPVQEPVHKLIYPGGGKALFNRLWHLTCNAVATQAGMRVRTDVMPMREMKEFLDHLCVLVDSPPQPVPAPVQEPQPVAYLMKHGQWSTNIETDEGMWLLEQFPSEDVQIPVYLAAQPPQGEIMTEEHSIGYQ